MAMRAPRLGGEVPGRAEVGMDGVVCAVLDLNGLTAYILSTLIPVLLAYVKLNIK